MKNIMFFLSEIFLVIILFVFCQLFLDFSDFRNSIIVYILFLALFILLSIVLNRMRKPVKTSPKIVTFFQALILLVFAGIIYVIWIFSKLN